MANQPQLSRRKALQFFAAAPLLPLGASFSVAALLAGCSSDDPAPAAIAPVVPAATYLGTSFTSSAAPTLADPAAMATTTVSSMLNVNFSDNTSQIFKLAYKPFFLTGDMVPDG